MRLWAHGLNVRFQGKGFGGVGFGLSGLMIIQVSLGFGALGSRAWELGN